MLHNSNYIYPVVFTYKTCQNIFFFGLKNGHFYIQVYFGKCMFCYFIDIRALSYYENDIHISRGTKVEKMLTLAPERYTAGFCMVAKVILWCI